MRNLRKLQIEHLDAKLQYFKDFATIPAPSKGWINMIRSTLNMTMEQLGNKLGITKQGVQQIEQREAKEIITLSSLKQAAEALDMRFFYGFYPKDGSLNKLIDKKAKELASRIVLRTHHNMKLESQSIEKTKIKQSIEELSSELKREMKKSLWDYNLNIFQVKRHSMRKKSKTCKLKQ
jgi:predicted DNA-binding mobile mystery protein A